MENNTCRQVITRESLFKQDHLPQVPLIPQKDHNNARSFMILACKQAIGTTATKKHNNNDIKKTYPLSLIKCILF